MELKAEKLAMTDPPYWAWLRGIKIDGRPFNLEGRKYQLEIMRPICDDGKVKHNEVIKKGSQTGATMGKSIEIAHGALHGMYPQGIIYFFPSRTAVEDFSGSRFKPLLKDNYEEIGKYCLDINSVYARRIGKTNVSFHGCTGTTLIGGIAKDSTAVRMTPADWILLDERDLFDDEMAAQVNQRLGNSTIRRRSDMGTPKLPDDGIDRLYCLVPDTKILTTDLRWVRLSEIKIGDKLIGFDESQVGWNKSRHYRDTEVIGYEKLQRPCYRITLDDGTEVTASTDHRWLVQTKSRGLGWRIVRNLKLGDRLVSIGTWETGVTVEDGYISGVYDGEGCVYSNRRKQTGGAALTFAQKDGAVFDKVKRLLGLHGFRTKDYMHHKVWQARLLGGLPEKLRFLGTYRPARLLPKAHKIYDDVSIGHDQGATKYPRIVKMEYAGFIDVIALGTEHNTFIANGLLSHNSKSDMGRWQIGCDCHSTISTPFSTLQIGKYTCLETEFPNCIKLDKDGKGYRACIHCGKPIDKDGENALWIPDSPTKDTVGYWCSQLLNPNVDLAFKLKEYDRPEDYDTTEAEFQRTVMGKAFARAEDVLRETEVYQCCTQDQMQYSHDGPCAMGFDVGFPLIHVVIGHRIGNDRYRLIKMARVPDWNALHDLAKRFNVKATVGDAMPESHKIREWAKTEAGYGNTVYPCYYTTHLKTFDNWSTDNIVKVNRTEVFDESHQMVVNPGRMLIPRRCQEIDIFAHQMCMAAKFLETDKRGNAEYHYRKIGDKQDHYRNALNYFYLASKKVGTPEAHRNKKKAVTQDMSYSL